MNPWWSVLLATLSGVIVTSLIAIYLDRRRAKREDLQEARKAQRDDERQWDKDVVRLAGGMITAATDLRLAASRHWYFHRSGHDYENEDQDDAQLSLGMSLIAKLMAELKLIAPSLSDVSTDFYQKCERRFVGEYEDMSGRGDFVMVDYADENIVTEAIEKLSRSVHVAIRLVPGLTSEDVGN